MVEPAPFITADMDKLLFRRQFVLAPGPIEGFNGWTRVRIGKEHYLAAHPDLGVHQAATSEKSITLLGYILDPDNPGRTNAEIVDALLERPRLMDELTEATSTLGGRWVLIANDKADTILFGDACGLRQIYYSLPGAGNGWCASQPGLIADSQGLEMDAEAVDFLGTIHEYEYGVKRLPGDTSPYKTIKLLLPNHYLNLGTGEARRFWPHADLASVDLEEAVEESTRLLLGMMKAAQRRFKMALALTAGWDSRIMLALCREFVRDVYCFTMAFPGSTETTNDIVIPAALLKRLGLTHHIIRYAAPVDAGFETIYRQNKAKRDSSGADMAFALYTHYPRELVYITGDAAEISKCYWRVPGVREEAISAQDLADLDNFGRHPFVLRAYDKWLSESRSRNVHLMDLFCWEQMAGRVQASIQAQYDIVLESFTPLNCRHLLAIMLSVDERYRKPPERKFLRELIARLWAEVLSEPINPPVGAREVISNLLRRWRVYDLIPPWLIRLGRRLIR